jgi:oligopeptide transport system substrate-binding protein
MKSTLDLEIKIIQQAPKHLLQMRDRGEFDIVPNGVAPDYADPFTFMHFIASWHRNSKNGMNYSNPKVDELLRKTLHSHDNKVRMKLMAEAEAIALEDVAKVSLIEGGSLSIQHPRLHGVLRPVIGSDPDFTRAWVSD